MFYFLTKESFFLIIEKAHKMTQGDDIWFNFSLLISIFIKNNIFCNQNEQKTSIRYAY